MTEHRTDDATARSRSRYRRLAWLTVGIACTLIVSAIVVMAGVSAWAALGRTSTQTESASHVYDRDVEHIGVDAVTARTRVEGNDGEQTGTQYDLEWSGAKPSVNERWRGNRLRMDTACQEDFPQWVSQVCRVDYTAQVPRDVGVRAVSTTGGIDVSDVDGNVRVRTTTGDVAVRGLGGRLHAKATTGDVTASSLRSNRVRARATTGDVALRFAQAPKRVTASVSTGSVTIELPRGSGPYRVDADAGTGEENVEVAQDPNAPTRRTIEVTTSTGDIDVRYVP